MSGRAEQHDSRPRPSAALWQAELSSAFDAPLAFWRRDVDGWTSHPEGDRAVAEVAAWLDELAHAPPTSAVARQLTNGQVWAAAACPKEGDAATAGDRAPLVVAGRVALDPLHLANRLAAAATELARARGESIENRDYLDGYGAKLIDCFEELTYLRRVAGYMEYCEAGRSLRDIARVVLPQLRELTRLEGLALLAAATRPSQAPDEPAAAPGLASAARPAAAQLPAPGEEPPACHELLYLAGSLGELRPGWRQALDDLCGQSDSTNVFNYLAGRRAAPRPAGWPAARSLLIVPVVKNEVVFGWLVGVNKLPAEPAAAAGLPGVDDEIGSVEASLVEATAVMLATHAANSRLFEDKETLVIDVIHALVGVIEAKDVYTCGHSDRVALIARRLAAELGLPPRDCHEIYLSGLLHDIGKVGTCDDVLLKPGELTREEFAQIKRHPEVGARLLKGLKPLERLIPGVLHHHESLDGSGYPAGLKGDDIPLMARVLAVADAFDAMTSDRPYRAGMPVAKAESILRAGAGRQWDPEVVSAYFAARADVLEIGVHWRGHLRQMLNRDDVEQGERVAVGAFAFAAEAGV